MTFHFAALAFLIVFAMGIFTWLCLPRASQRAVATGAFAALTIGAFAASVESTGQPKPLQFEWRNVLDAQVVGMDWDEARQVVWLWIRVGDQPVSYSLPWPKDKQAFGALQDRWRRRGATGDEFHYNADGNIAKVVPPPPQPEKTQ